MEKRRRVAKAFQIVILAFLALSSVGLISRGAPPKQPAAVQEQERKQVARAAEITPWPPVPGQTFPDLELIHQQGGTFRLSDLKGKVVVVEPIGMNCPACQGWSGANTRGSFENNAVQSGLTSFKRMLPVYAGGLTFPHGDIVLVQLLLYDMKMGPPDAKDAARWAEHFGFNIADGEFVAVAPHDMRNKASYAMIPGFYLLDKNLTLRSDATGHHPRHNLYKHTLPMIPQLLAESSAGR